MRYLELSNSYRLSMGDCQGLGEGGNVELLLNRYRISLWEVKIVLEREHSDINCSNFFFFFGSVSGSQGNKSENEHMRPN